MTQESHALVDLGHEWGMGKNGDFLRQPACNPNIAPQAIFWGGSDVRMQFVQGICILHGQNKAKK
jgi:hypothetical protein